MAGQLRGGCGRERPASNSGAERLLSHASAAAQYGAYRLLRGELLGFIAASRESIAQLYVRNDHQRRGIGRQMLEWAKEQSGGTLWLYTFARNAGAQRFYEREGFRVVARGFEPRWQLEDIKYEWSRSGSL